MSVSRCGHSLVEPRFANSVEGYVIVDPFEDPTQKEVGIQAFVRNYGVDKEVVVELEFCGNILHREYVKLSTGERYGLKLYARAKEECAAKLIIDGTVIDTHKVDTDILSSNKNSTNILFVFHNHQPPNYDPSSVYRSLWPFVYVWKPVLFPYSLGPYYYHAILLKKLNGGTKLTYNLSPSLIKQWSDAVENGIKVSNGEVIEPSSDLIKLVRETIDAYRELALKGFIEVLTSVYAHTICGYLADVLGLEDVVKRQMEYGFNITKNVAGVEPRGLWLPEMSFSMKLIPIIKSLNIEYVFLDERFHLKNAEGDIGDHYEPYIVENNREDSLTVFFRDTELSNDISFANNYCSDIHAIKGAYTFALKIVRKCAINRARVLVVALDGENWMVFSGNPPATAVFLESMLKVLEKISRIGLIKLVTAKESLELTPPTRKLRYIPSTTWLGSYSKWRGEIEEHEAFWQMVEQRITKFKKYIAEHGADEKIKKAEWALWHILDSDYWWADFWDENKGMITLWINEFDKYIN